MRILVALVFFVFSLPTYSYVSCEAHVKEILPAVTNGVVWIELTDKTKILGSPDKPGLDRNMSVALAALMADKKVRVLLNDGESCGVNSHDRWTYIVAFKQ